MASTPYDIWATALQSARSRLNDNIATLAADSGKLLDLSQPHAQRLCSLAFRKMQEFLAMLKYSGMEQETTFVNLPAATTADPLVQVKLGYDAYYPDGVTPNNSFVLPQTLVRPYKLWERINGVSAPNNQLLDMDEMINGLPSIPKLPWNRQWEWRDDVLYMPGATVNTDLRMRYGAYFADPADNSPANNTPWYGQVIPIMRPIDALADYICREVEIARQNPDAALAFQASAENNARLLVQRDTTQPQATPNTAQLGQMRTKYTPMAGQPQTSKR